MATIATRYNNPGAIRPGKLPYKGQIDIADTASGKFAVFATPQAGVAKFFDLAAGYIASGLNTPAKFITRYAPPNENITSQYIAAVESKVGKTILNATNKAQMFELAKAIFKMEGADFSKYTPDVIEAGWRMHSGEKPSSGKLLSVGGFILIAAVVIAYLYFK